MRFYVIGLSMACALLAGCKKEDIVSHARYKCVDGSAVKMTFRNGQQVEIETPDGVVTLPRVESDSGAKYEGDGLMVWVKGKDAQYTVKAGTEPVKCIRG